MSILFVGLHKTPTVRGKPGREIVDANYRRVKVEFVRQGEVYSTVENYRFFRGRTTRRHAIAEFGVYDAARAGTLLWYCAVNDKPLKAGYQYLLVPGNLMITLQEMTAILHQARPTSFQLVAGAFSLRPPPARIVAHAPFVPIKGSDDVYG